MPTYSVNVICSNCDYNGSVELAKGLLIDDVLPMTPCPTCGCKVLTKKSDIKKEKPNPFVSPSRQKPNYDPFGPTYYITDNTRTIKPRNLISNQNKIRLYGTKLSQNML